MAAIYNLLICTIVGASYFFGAILYKIAPEEVNPFLKEHKMFKTMGKYISYQAIVLGLIFGLAIVKSEEILSMFSLLIFLYVLVAASIASQRKTLKNSAKELVAPFILFTAISWIISSVL